MGKIVLVVMAFFIPGILSAQKQIERRDQSWFAYFNQTRFTDRSGIWLDLQLRFNDYLQEESTGIARLGYTYYLSDQLRLTAGYGHVIHYSLSDQLPDVPEARPWQQVQWFARKKRLALSQYFRVEERFVRQVSDGELTDVSRFNWRFRYNFGVTIPLTGEPGAVRAPFVFLNDELHVNAGKNIVNNYFDQNRLFAGLGYQFSSGLNAHLGYLYVFQQLPVANRFVHINAVRLFVFHNLDFRNK